MPIMQKQTKQITIPWDIHYSTYYWEIYLDRKNGANNPMIEKFTGYSKKERQSEAQDIQHLLKAKIYNLNKNGYLERCERIVIYQRTGEMINKRFDPNILVLYPRHYDIPTENHEYTFKRFSTFLDELYRRKRDNLSMEGLLPKLKSRWSKDDFLDIHKMSFHNISQLYSHAARLLVHGHPHGEVENFITKYKELKGWLHGK